jgi:hypothetical protein
MSALPGIVHRSAKGCYAGVIPAALLAVTVLSVLFFKLERSREFLGDVEFCISSSNQCNDFSVQTDHSITVLDSGHVVCTESNAMCIDALFRFDDFRSEILSSDSLKQIAIESSSYFPLNREILILSLLALFLCLIIFGIHADSEFKYSHLYFGIRKTIVIQRVVVLICMGIAILCFAALLEFSMFRRNDCNKDSNIDICEILAENSLAINSLTPTTELAQIFHFCMIGCSLGLIITVLSWAFCLPTCGSSAVYVDLECDTHELTVTRAHALLCQLMLTPTNNTLRSANIECHICLETIGEKTPVERGKYQHIRIIAWAQNGDDDVNEVSCSSEDKNKKTMTCSCGHSFHYDCIHMWLATRWTHLDMETCATCPVCRALLCTNCTNSISDSAEHQRQLTTESV